MSAIFSELMKEGVLVEPRAAERIARMECGEMKALLERLRQEKPLILSEEFFENIIDVSEFQEQKKFSIQESAAALNAYFNVLQSLFEKKNRAVSISNASGNASLIGLVRGVQQDGFDLEDQTGAVKIVSKAQVADDDVVMVSGKAAGKIVYADLVEFPDLQERTMKKSPKKCEIVFGKPSEDADYSISFGESTRIEKNSLTVGKSPVQVKINNIAVLVCSNERNIPPQQILKKRRLPGTLFAIADVPDILLLPGAENFYENYKGTTIVAVDGKSLARISLMTMEVKFEAASEEAAPAARP
jgi:hypothetical protein